MAAKSIRVAGTDSATRIRLLGTALQREQPKTLRKALNVAKVEQERQIRRDSGGDMRLSGAGKAKGRAGNARLGVSVKVAGTTGEVKATGPIQFINNDTGGRVIRSAYQRGRYRRSSRGRGGGVASQFIGPALSGQTFTGDRRAVLKIPGIGYRRFARHPGTKGKRTWQVGRKAAEPKVRKEMESNTTNALARAIKGK